MTANTIALVGNPNCGKTTIFNALAGVHQQVGNWPGVTVEKTIGRYQYAGREVTVVDLPGVYSIGVASEASLDERVARDYAVSGEADVFVNIVDASNLERNLYLTAQLLEIRLPMVVVLNMMDVARDRQIDVDVTAISDSLGCPVVPLIAHRGDGIEHLRAAVDTALASRPLPTAEITYPPEVETVIRVLASAVEQTASNRQPDARWVAMKLLEEDAGIATLAGVEALNDAVDRQRKDLIETTVEDIDLLFADSRYGFAHDITQRAARRIGVLKRSLTDRIDRVVMHRLLGIPIFFGVMYLLFLFTINVGSAFIDFFDIFVGTLLVDGVGTALEAAGSPAWLTTVIANGVGGGIQTVATFVPVITCLYLFLSFLEDSGYMARAAFVMDRMMRAVGLPGKSFIPLIVGFGCNVPAIMATRTLESRRDRLLTVNMAPFMSCGARLPVYALFAAAFFPTGGQNLVFALYLIGILFAILTGLVLKNTLLRGEASPFVMELPPYHLPTLKGILIRTWDRLKAFVIRAGRVIVLVVVALSFLNSFGTDGSFGNEDTDRSALAAIGKALTPVVEPMGIKEDNWPATVGLFTGIFAKEAVVGTLDALYSQLAVDESVQGGAEPEEAFSLSAGLIEAFASIPANLAGLADAALDPLGLNIGDMSTINAAAAEQGVATGTFGAMATRFDGQVGAFAYLLAILLYMPCVAAIAAIYREVGAAWSLFAAAWTTGLGYGAAVLAYQIGTFSRHPDTALLWIIAILGVLTAALATMRYIGGRGGSLSAPAAAGVGQ